MSTVAEVAVKYGAKGTNAAIRADRKVRDSVKETAQTARQERGEINRWMERHKSSIQTIGVATAAAMGAIISASPTMRAELSGVRTAFSLFADTVVNDVLPEGSSLTDMAFRLEEAYANLPDPVREVISAAIVFGGVLATIAIAAAGLQSILAGTLVAKGLSMVGGAIAGVVSGSLLLAGVIGTIIGLAGVWALELLGVMDAVRRLARWVGERLPNWAIDAFLMILSVIMPILLLLGAAVNGFIDDGLSGAIERGREMLGLFGDAWGRMGDRVADLASRGRAWTEDMIDKMVAGIKNRLGNLRSKMGTVRDDVESDINGMIDSAHTWGTDLIDEFIDGIEARIPNLGSVAEKARGKVEDFISFDETRNDRAARRWGRDMIEEKAKGVMQATPTLEGAVGQAQLAPQPSPTGGGGGGGPTIIFESGAIQVGGSGSPKRTAEKTADEVSQTIQDDYRSRR